MGWGACERALKPHLSRKGLSGKAKAKTGIGKSDLPGLQGGLGKRGHGGTGNPLRKRKREAGNPPPTAGRARALSRPRPDLWETRGEIPRVYPAKRSRHVWVREMSANDPLTKRRKDSDDSKTRVSLVSWEQHGRYLLSDHAGSGVQAA